MFVQCNSASTFESSRIQEELNSILASPGFRSSPQISAFLSFVVGKVLAGKSSCLKAYTIATEALGRPASFDPLIDSTVRVLAGRVRAALEVHYFKTGFGSDIIIELLPGSYVPQFRASPPHSAAPSHNSVVRPVQFRRDSDEPVPAKQGSTRRLLILEDEEDIRSILHRVGTAAGYSVVDTACANDFWVAYRALKPTHVILDLILPGADGLEIMRELGRLSAECRVTLISGVDPRLLRTSERLGREFGLDMTQAIGKPFDIEVVNKAITQPINPMTEVDVEELAHGIEQMQMVLHFLPKVDLRSDSDCRISGVEALVRWNHPRKGLLSPDTFIPLAEESGLIVPLTERVFDLAIRQLTELDVKWPGCTMALNVSAAILDDPLLPDLFAAKLDLAGIEHSRFIIEITETTVTCQQRSMIDSITRLRLKGFSLSIDDFGTGYSSLVRLLQLPFSELKIDRYFIGECLKNDEARLIVETVIKLCKSLGLHSCAEGVESEECLQLLRSFGCDYAQGFLLSKPVPADRITAVLSELDKKEWQAA